MHPQVWNQVIKMYKYCYDTEEKIKAVLNSLQLDKAMKDVTNENVYNFFSHVSDQDAYKILRDILEVPDFWPDANDLARRKNYDTSRYNLALQRLQSLSALTPHNEPSEPILNEEKLWGDQLVNLLERKEGIYFDKNTKNFARGGVDQVMILPLKQAKKSTLIKEISQHPIANDPFYHQLVKEINNTYLSGFYTSTVILSRKLFENLLIDLLRKKYPESEPGNLELYYNANEGRHQDFSYLIDVLHNKKTDFLVELKTVVRVITKLNHFRENANATAHTITIIPNAEEVLQYQIEEILDLLLRLANEPRSKN